MSDGDGERVQTWLLPGVRRLQRWRRGHVAHHATRHVTLGRLADGRWLVEHSDVKVGSYAYRSERKAREEVARLTADGEWVEQPAEFDAAQQPIGGGWRRAGGTWVRDRSEDAADDG